MKQIETFVSPAQENAMTEIALALAMGFFSIMVLTMISMGADDTAVTTVRPAVLAMAPAAAPGSAAAAEAARSRPDDIIFIYHAGRYLDTSLQPVKPDAVFAAMSEPDRRIVLALDPSLSVKEAMAARQQLKVQNLVVSSLDERWLKAIAAAKEGDHVR